MIEKCTHSYLDNDLLRDNTHPLAHQIVVYIQNTSKLQERIEFKVYGWTKVLQIKQHIIKITKIPQLTPHDLRILNKNIELSKDTRTLSDYNIENGSLLVVQRRNKIQQGSKGIINPYKLFQKSNQRVQNLIKQSVKAIDSSMIPTLTSQGTSGVYMIENKDRKRISIFKPFDQQVNAPNNPRNKVGELGSDGICKGILSGQCATRQVAAFLLDNQNNNLHGVPTTTYIQFYHPTFKHNKLINETPIASSQQIKLNIGATKHGSLQQFAISSGLVGDYGSKRLADKQIHKIGILDIRILNCDRNQENILVKQSSRDSLQLIPIDHGLSFPDNLQIYEDSIIWMGYPQSKKPFTQEQLKFIQQINPTTDAQLLKSKLGFRPICLRNFRVSQMFLKKSAAHGFTLYEMGKMLYRTQDYDDQNNKSKRSNIQSIVMQAQNLYLNAIETIQKQNIQPLNNLDLTDDIFDFYDENDQDMEQKNSNTNSSSTCGSIKNLLSLRKKVSLPQLQKKNTTYHESRSKARKQRQGINGINKTIWNKYHKQQWNQLFYYYFDNLLETLLLEKSMQKSRKLIQKTQSAK